MHTDKELYFLQPSSDQAISLTRILKKNSNILINAVLLKQEKYFSFLDRIYDRIITVNSYKDLSNDKNNIIVPFGAQSTEALLLEDNIKLNSVIMSQSVLNVYNKPKFLRFCEDANLPIPKTYMNVNQIKENDFPIFYKERYEQGGGTRGIAYSKKEIPISYKESLIYQEFIDTKGTYAVGFIANEGRLLNSFCHFEELSYPTSGGSAIIVKTIEDNRLKELTESFIMQSNYSGWGLAEFKWCNKRQDYVFMEINAKFWASCELAFRNDPTFIELLFSIKSSKEEIDGLVFINRAFSTGLLEGLKIINHYSCLHKVVYPRLFFSTIRSSIPKSLVSFIKQYSNL